MRECTPWTPRRCKFGYRIPSQLSSSGRKLRIWNTFKQLQEHKKDKALAGQEGGLSVVEPKKLAHAAFPGSHFHSRIPFVSLFASPQTAMHKNCNEDKAWHKIWQIVSEIIYLIEEFLAGPGMWSWLWLELRLCHSIELRPRPSWPKSIGSIADWHPSDWSARQSKPQSCHSNGCVVSNGNI